MRKITSLIRADKEFSASLDAACSSFDGEKLPIIVNGLTDGAQEAYVTEAAASLCQKAPVLVLTENETERDKLFESFSDLGIKAYRYKKRDA